jgi:hypothetical protein
MKGLKSKDDWVQYLNEDLLWQVTCCLK